MGFLFNFLGLYKEIWQESSISGEIERTVRYSILRIVVCSTSDLIYMSGFILLLCESSSLFEQILPSLMIGIQTINQNLRKETNVLHNFSSYYFMKE